MQKAYLDQAALKPLERAQRNGTNDKLYQTNSGLLADSDKKPGDRPSVYIQDALKLDQQVPVQARGDAAVS